ncbi:MAG: SpoVA/SpoVAEb family sporulation membrane protein [Clostridia bacterium]|nr:SpoVA/SpoVAEb family sporulation membrane protein [Clostridia bacterium]
MSVHPLLSLCPILTVAEGYVLGVGANMFKIAGSVIVYGVMASVIYGVVYWIINLL